MPNPLTPGKKYSVDELRKEGYPLPGMTQIDYTLPQGWRVKPGSLDPNVIEKDGGGGTETGGGSGGGGSAPAGGGGVTASSSMSSGSGDGGGGSGQVLNSMSRFRQGIGQRTPPVNSASLAALRRIY